MSKLKRKYLKEEEMLKIDLKNAEMKHVDHAVIAEKLRIEKDMLSIKTIEQNIELRKNKISRLMDEKTKLRDKLKQYTESIKKACGVKNEKWGFDPDSGEIKL